VPPNSRVPVTPTAVTMRDIAEAAGVSISTISLVLNDRPGARISSSTRSRVQAVAQELGYRPNRLARGLQSGTSRFIGLLSEGVATSPFAGQILQGAQDEAWANGFVLLVVDSDGSPEHDAAAIRMMSEHRAVGILYSTWYHHAISLPEELDASDHVLVNCFDPSREVPAVLPDEASGGLAATRALLAACDGGTVFLNTTQDSPARIGRLEGYERAHEEAGRSHHARVIDFDPDKYGGFQEAGFEVVSRLVEANDRPQGIFCYNDRVAMGVYEALRCGGLRIPDDVAVVGFDNQEVIAAHLRPPLTTVALPHYELGRQGVRTLLGLEERRTQLLECPLVLRKSTATETTH